jgi:hypothetical protein
MQLDALDVMRKQPARWKRSRNIASTRDKNRSALSGAALVNRSLKRRGVSVAPLPTAPKERTS